MGGYVPSVERVTGSPNIHYFPEKSGGGALDFYTNDLVKLDSTGGLVAADAGGDNTVLGIVQQNAPGAGNETTMIPVDVLDGSEEISVKYKASPTAQTLVGDVVDFTIVVSATAGSTVDESGATTDAVVIDRDVRDEWGTSGGRLIVRFFSDVLQTVPST